MRRSSREIKKPDIYVPLSQGSARVVSAKRGHETDEESKSNGAASDQDSDEDDDASEVEGKAGKRSVKKARKQGVSKTTKVDSVMRKLKRVSIQVADEETDSPDGKVTSSSKGRTKKAEKVIISGNAFFDSLQAGKKCSTLVSDWIARYTTHRVACNVEILNFIMLSAGATKCWIKSDIDLEPLDGAEILELLTDMVQAMTSSDKPTSVSLRSATKQAGKTFSDRYVAFWSAFLPALLESSDGAEDSGLEILKGVISIMISCSAMPIAGIRLAITLGLLAIARSLQSSLLGCRNKSDFAARQLEAEGKVSAKGKKFMAIERQKKDYDSTIEAMQAISDGLFDSIFVHRYKDTMPDVRCSCAAHLGEWLPIDPASCFRDEYLKYLGWMCSDRDTNVRREIVKSIDKLLEAKDVSHQAKLVNFIERFTERFIEMAVGDVDDAVCVLALKLLRHLQRKGLLDAVMSEDQLDRVDEVVFDSSASLSARREAMGFVFDHTEGFEVDDSNYDDDKHPVGKRKGKENVLHKQRVYQQLLTITEFAEHHLVELTLALPPSRSSTAVENGLELGLEYVRMIVEACADLPQKALLRDWEAMTALLLRDGEESESLPPLSPLHASILIRLFVYSAQTCVCTTVNGSFSEINAKISSADAENLSECLQEDLVPLLTRYRDNDDNLRTLLLLLSCYDTSTVSQKVIKPLLKLLSDIYLSSNSSLVLEGVANSFRCMHLKAEHLRATVDATLSTLLRSIWSVITKNSPQIKRGKDFTGALYSLCSSLSRLKVLWTQMNCRRLFPVSTDELADELIESAELLLPHSGIGASNASDAESLCVSSSQDIARCLFAMVLWPTRDLYMHAKQQYGETGSESSHEQSDSEWEGKAAEIISLRDKLIDCLHTWLQIEPEEETSYDPLGVEAFKLISDLRVLFSSRNKDCKYVSELAWTPPQDLVNSLRLVFDRSTSMLALQMESLGDSEEDAKKRALLSAQCVKDLLCPLGIATIYNIENLNRRQAAAVLCHLTDPDESVQDLLRVWVKRLKDFDPAKYLEVQMVALKIMFNENIVSAQASAEEDDSLDAQKVAAEGYKKVESFALRLAGTLGVAKVKGDLLQALSTFLKVGIDFAFSDGLTTLGFVRILTYYLRLLPTAELRQLAEHIDTHLVENAGIASELSDIRNAPREVKALADLASVLGGFGKNAVRKRKGSSPDESATSESEGTPDVVPKAISKPTKRSNVKLPAVEESPEVPDAAWEDKEEENRSPDVKAKPTRGTRATRAAAQPSPPRTKMTTPVKTAISAAGQRPTAISSTDPFWNRDASSSVQKKYTTRQYSASKTGSEASESYGKPIRSPRRQGAPPPAVLPVPLFVTGLHLESISPIASSDSSSRVSRRSSQGVSQEDPHHSTPVTFAEQDVSKIFAEIKQIPSRRRNR